MSEIETDGAAGGDGANEINLPASNVKARYGGVSDMWIWRRLRDNSNFPSPVDIGGRRFWRLSELVAWERSRPMFVPRPRAPRDRNAA